ncbi:SP_1767 family glycosyltransferase [Limosilactobacillus pontis]|uniref:SP_1767 family glycosyltransferase n=1 Tax=Limosilactobacillus pontis TaxID=35787 RepID=UPI00241F7F74|nr:SP_1767 family glycosyltransferase [Limosilactobacillus pontis]
MHIKEEIVYIINLLCHFFFRYRINVLSIDETLIKVKKERKNVIRFGDGEFNLIQGRDIAYQRFNKQLSNRLEQILLSTTKSNLMICLPDIFNSLKKYTLPTEKFWLNNLRKNRKLFDRIDTKKVYGNAFMTRPYMEMRDKSKSSGYFTLIKELWEDKDLLVVEGKYTRSGIGNDLYDNAKSIRRIVCPSENAFSYLNQIERAILKEKRNSMILLMLGPTAKIIVDDFDYLGNQIIDMGHIDTEYEWFQKGYKEKVKLDNKHTAEFNNDEDIEPLYDSNYESQVIKVIGE